MEFGAQSLDHEHVQQDIVGIEHEAGHGRPKRVAALFGDPSKRSGTNGGSGRFSGVRQGKFKISRSGVEAKLCTPALL